MVHKFLQDQCISVVLRNFTSSTVLALIDPTKQNNILPNILANGTVANFVAGL